MLNENIETPDDEQDSVFGDELDDLIDKKPGDKSELSFPSFEKICSILFLPETAYADEKQIKTPKIKRVIKRM